MLVAALLLFPTLPWLGSASAGCFAEREHTTVAIPSGATYYLQAYSTSTQRYAWVFQESNGVPGLQSRAGCGESADTVVEGACYQGAFGLDGGGLSCPGLYGRVSTA